MIARLRGEVLEVGSGRIVVDVGGIGYEVLMPESVLLAVGQVGQTVDLRIRHVFREDGHYLFGFLNSEQRQLFDMLTGVKGCGPKLAMAIIGEFGEQGAVSAIATQDAKLLTRTSGVGPRMAERIIVELKDKVQELALLQKAAVSLSPNGSVDNEVVDALLALGYRRQEAEMAALEVRSETDDVEDQLRAALRRLAK